MAKEPQKASYISATDKDLFSVATLPLIEGPLTRVCDHMMTNQSGQCRDRELDFFRCASRVGILKAETACAKLLDDFMECEHMDKQVAYSF